MVNPGFGTASPNHNPARWLHCNNGSKLRLPRLDHVSRSPIVFFDLQKSKHLLPVASRPSFIRIHVGRKDLIGQCRDLPASLNMSIARFGNSVGLYHPGTAYYAQILLMLKALSSAYFKYVC